MSDVPTLIDRLGGYAKVAGAIGVPTGTVAAWRHRRSIPSGYWARLIASASRAELGTITGDDLMAAHAPIPAPPLSETARA